MQNKNSGKQKEVKYEDILEGDPNLVQSLINWLETSKEVIEDFAQIAKLDTT